VLDGELLALDERCGELDGLEKLVCQATRKFDMKSRIFGMSSGRSKQFGQR